MGGLQTRGGFQTRPYTQRPNAQRRSIRLRNYDYTQNGAYFMTICVQDRACLLGDVVGGEMRLNEAGQRVQDVWMGLPDHYPHLQLDAWVIMPNHVHGIIVLHDGTVRPSPLPQFATDCRKSSAP